MSVSQTVSQSGTQLVSQYVSQYVSQSTSMSVSQSVNQLVSQSACSWYRTPSETHQQIESLCQFCFLSLFKRSLWRDSVSIPVWSHRLCRLSLHTYRQFACVLCSVLKSNFATHYIAYTIWMTCVSPGLLQHVAPSLSGCYNSSSDSWTAVRMTAAKFGPFILVVISFAFPELRTFSLSLVHETSACINLWRNRIRRNSESHG